MTPIYIFDLDGTLADTEHRVHLLNGGRTPEDWTKFFSLCDQDKPIWPVIHILQSLDRSGMELRIWTGRSDEVWTKTVDWLYRYVWAFGLVPTGNLRMRPHGDHTADDVLKRRWLHELPDEDRARIHGVFDDRDRVVAMWRAEGIPCFQVAPGAF